MTINQRLIGDSYTIISDKRHREKALIEVNSKKEMKRKLEARVSVVIAGQNSTVVVDANLDGVSFVSKPMFLCDE